ncbi:hypothetical protein MYX84_07575 [Acidobacteria bacterium AH-259-O06]|nr:hypothetical protein [Acidobacteria bacterium AH-259-O06]
MANNNFSELLVNPKSRPESKELESQNADLPQPSRGTVTVLTILSVVALALGGVLTYYLHHLSRQQSTQAQALEVQLAAVNQSLELIGKRLDGNGEQITSLQSQLEVTMRRVGVTQRDLKRAQALAEQLREEQTRSVEALTQEIAQRADTQLVSSFKEEAGEKFQGVNQEISTVKEEVKSNQRELTTTLQKLTRLGVRVTEQGNMIATTATGLEELKRRGERDYVTFDLRKKQRTRVAGIGLELRKADRKRQRTDLRIYVNDVRMERKNINVNTPVNFYVGSQRIGYELVINEVHKDRISGYVSVPKGKLFQGRPALKP